MAQESIEVAGVDEGFGTPVPESVAEIPADTGTAQPEAPAGPPNGYENTPPELWPDANGNPPQLTEALMRQLRGKYFTIRHTVGECGHKIDSINQPKVNCHACWAVFFNTHPQLAEVAHQFYRTQGRGPMVAMRGEKFVKMFEKYMALLYQMHLERKKQEELNRGVQRDSGGAAPETSGVSPETQSGSEAVLPRPQSGE